MTFLLNTQLNHTISILNVLAQVPGLQKCL